MVVAGRDRSARVDGYGRNDAFGVGRNELFGAYKNAKFHDRRSTRVPADAPVSFPHLWGMEHTSWFQWGANTNSVIERNIGQALGVGATYQPDTGFSSTVRLDNLHAMETLQYKLTAPAVAGGTVRPDRSGEGGARTRRSSIAPARCATRPTRRPARSTSTSCSRSTSSARTRATAINFERMVMTDEGPMPFGAAAFEIVKKVKAAYYRENETPPDVQARVGGARQRGRHRSIARRCAITRSFYDTRERGVYRAKTLKGIWATAPVPAQRIGAQRVRSAPAGREAAADVPPRHEGVRPGEARLRGGRPRFVTPKGMQPGSTFDTSLLGNWNTGHEWWFYPRPRRCGSATRSSSS